MRLNPVKCKEMFIDFLHYKPHHPPPLQLSGSEIECVHTYKLLGVYVTHNLCWSTHCEYSVQRVCKCLYALRCLKKSRVMKGDLVLVYSSLIRSVLEYASPVWANLPEYLSLLIESVQKKALEIIFPGFPTGTYLCTVVFVLSRTGMPQHALSLSREFGTPVSLLTCYHSAQLCSMDTCTIYVQAPSERISPWPLLTVSTKLIHYI